MFYAQIDPTEIVGVSSSSHYHPEDLRLLHGIPEPWVAFDTDSIDPDAGGRVRGYASRQANGPITLRLDPALGWHHIVGRLAVVGVTDTGDLRDLTRREFDALLLRQPSADDAPDARPVLMWDPEAVRGV